MSNRLVGRDLIKPYRMPDGRVRQKDAGYMGFMAKVVGGAVVARIGGQ